jgi:hypothetical protein
VRLRRRAEQARDDHAAAADVRAARFRLERSTAAFDWSAERPPDQ